MRLIRWHHDSARRETDCAITVGSFDGLHVGHQALVARTRLLARQRNLPAAMLSFEPLPREYLQADDPPARLTNFRERWRLLAASGLDRFYVLRFDAGLRQLSGAQFMQLLRAAGARQIVVGHDFRFGRHGQASAEWCRTEGAAYGFEVEVLPPVTIGGERVGSRMVRTALAAGELARARELLDRPYTMRGRVRRGEQLGRKLGFPTANIAMHRRRVPLSGIFAVRASSDGSQGPPLAAWPAVASLGTRPTVNGVEPLLEVHLFDFDGELYGREVEVEFVGKLRDEQKFASLDLMVEQMQRDAAEARRLLLG